MGEVYRARDTNLDRVVAIKVLPKELADDTERRARFGREAKLLASLNHPNIASIHGFEAGALVLELIEGETLRERIRGAPLPLAEVIRLFTQIAAGLELAHEKGVVHRDLKPANIMVTSAGQVKILDFGLARALGRERVGDDSAESETLERDLTASGVVLGTPAYLSPEQARGQAVDRRTDLWAFGCVLFEALTGRQAFTGETVSDTIVAILEREPALDLLPAETPPAIRALVRRCLRKESTERQRDAGDAGLALKEDSPEPVVPASKKEASRVSKAAPWIVTFALAALGSVLAWNLKPIPPQAPWMHATLQLAEHTAQRFGTPVFSPDGAAIVYVADLEAGGTQLRLRPFDEVHATPIPGTENATQPFFSPDGQSIGFFIGGELWVVPVGGGPPQLVSRSTGPARGGSWGADGSIVFAPGPYAGLRVVPASGGDSQPLTEVADDESSHIWPQILPGGESVLFIATSSGSDVAVQSLTTGERKTVVRGASYARYVRTGHVVYARDGSLFAVRFDEARLQTDGAPVTFSRGFRNDRSTFPSSGRCSTLEPIRSGALKGSCPSIGTEPRKFSRRSERVTCTLASHRTAAPSCSTSTLRGISICGDTRSRVPSTDV